MNDYNNPYASTSTPPSPYGESTGPKKQSGLGIASFIIAVFCGIVTFLLFAVAGYMETSTPGGIDEESPVIVLMGLGILGMGFMLLVGAGLGIAALCQSDRNKLFGILGLVLNMLALLLFGGLMAIGIAAEGA